MYVCIYAAPGQWRERAEQRLLHHNINAPEKTQNISNTNLGWTTYHSLTTYVRLPPPPQATMTISKNNHLKPEGRHIIYDLPNQDE